jgi:hypothetical protein
MPVDFKQSEHHEPNGADRYHDFENFNHSQVQHEELIRLSETNLVALNY